MGKAIVITATIEDSSISFRVELGKSVKECKLIKENTPSDTELRNNKIIELHKQGKSCRQITEILNTEFKVSKDTCNRVIRNFEANK